MGIRVVLACGLVVLAGCAPKYNYQPSPPESYAVPAQPPSNPLADVYRNWQAGEDQRAAQMQRNMLPMPAPPAAPTQQRCNWNGPQWVCYSF